MREACASGAQRPWLDLGRSSSGDLCDPFLSDLSELRMGEAVVSEFEDTSNSRQNLGHLDRNLAHMLFQHGAHSDHLFDLIVMNPEPWMLMRECR